VNNLGAIVFLVVNYIVVLIAYYFLWRSARPLYARVIWSIVLPIPLVGLIFYGWMSNPPPPLPGHKRQGVSDYVATGAEEQIDYDHGVKKHT
jgi:amino acid transporter